jgi:hypothetical protein
VSQQEPGQGGFRMPSNNHATYDFCMRSYFVCTKLAHTDARLPPMLKKIEEQKRLELRNQREQRARERQRQREEARELESKGGSRSSSSSSSRSSSSSSSRRSSSSSSSSSSSRSSSGTYVVKAGSSPNKEAAIAKKATSSPRGRYHRPAIEVSPVAFLPPEAPWDGDGVLAGMGHTASLLLYSVWRVGRVSHDVHVMCTHPGEDELVQGPGGREVRRAALRPRAVEELSSGTLVRASYDHIAPV